MMHSSGVWEADFKPSGPQLFDYIRCSMDIGFLTNVTCETPCLGGQMMRYWVSPVGQLFVIDYEGTHDFVIVSETSPDYDHQYHWRNTSIKPNGCRGVVAPVDFTGNITLAPNPNLQPEMDWQFANLVFVDGMCQLE